MRQIKASEVKPGMEVEFTHTRRMKVCYSYRWNDFEHGLEGVSRDVTFVDADAPVTVLSEPAPPQPEEPTEFGVRVIAGGFPALRILDGADEIDPHAGPWRVRMGRDTWGDLTWDELCEMGPVTVVPDQGWTVPADTPEVPERIEEWPDNDEHLRPYPWRDRDEYIWKWFTDASEWKCHNAMGNYVESGGRPTYGPWTRVADG